MVIKITGSLCLCVGQEQPRLPNVKAMQYNPLTSVQQPETV